jgi:molybdate transport system substrate-binding protein
VIVKRRFSPVWAALLCAAAIGCGAGSGGSGAERRQVRVAAASDLNAALGDLASRFAAAEAIDVTASYGSSGTLFAQLVNGAPFDMFLSADLEYPRHLTERGLTLDRSDFIYALGRLVLWTSPVSPVDVKAGGVRLLLDPAVKRIAVANPEHAPYGRAAVAALRSAGVYDQVKPRLIYGENVAQALQFVQSGSADVGLVALSVAVGPGARGGSWVEVPPSDYPPLEQGGVIMRSAQDADAARAFRDFLIGDTGRSILQQHGFSAPGP